MQGIQALQVLGHIEDTPSRAHLFLVSLFATHSQLLVIFFPFFFVLKRTVESLQVVVVGAVVIGVTVEGAAVGVGVGDLVGVTVEGEDVGVGVGDLVGVAVGEEVGGKTQMSLSYTSVSPSSPVHPMTAS